MGFWLVCFIVAMLRALVVITAVWFLLGAMVVTTGGTWFSMSLQSLLLVSAGAALVFPIKTA